MSGILSRKKISPAAWGLIRCLGFHGCPGFTSFLLINKIILGVQNYFFWEGRFKCQVLADERAVLAAMAYVDLNPIRAGITLRLDHSHHTSIQQRVLTCRSDEAKAQQKLKPLLGLAPALSLKQGDYIELVQWTGQQVRADKKGAIPKNAPPALRKTGCTAEHWPVQLKAVGSGYWRMIGSAEQLLEKAEAIGQRWLKGVAIARQIQKA